MFKQLAEKLASHGISSLRYDKRTLLYKHGADTITYKEETVDDAVAAARQLFAEGYKHIFVAGHSLGGHCIPLIAEHPNQLSRQTTRYDTGADTGDDFTDDGGSATKIY